MKVATILLAATVSMGSTVLAKHTPPNTTQPSDEQGQPTTIRKGITLAQAEQIARANATPVGAASQGVQTFRLMTREIPKGGGPNSHPVITFYMLGVSLTDGVITWVHKN